MGGTDWIDLAQERDKWRCAANVCMKLRALESESSVWTGRRTSEVELSCMGLVGSFVGSLVI